MEDRSMPMEGAESQDKVSEGFKLYGMKDAMDPIPRSGDDPPIPVSPSRVAEGTPAPAKNLEQNLDNLALKPTKQRKRVYTHYSPELCAKFVDYVERTGLIAESARAVGSSESSIQNWRRVHPEFDQQVKEAQHIYCNALEAEAHRRAFVGVCEPVFYQGKICGEIRRYSDRLIELLLKKHDPQGFREGVQINTNIGGVLVVGQPAKTEEEWVQSVEHHEPPDLPSTPTCPGSPGPGGQPDPRP